MRSKGIARRCESAQAADPCCKRLALAVGGRGREPRNESGVYQ